MDDTLAQSFRAQAEQYHEFADGVLRNCRSRPACYGCRRASDGYRAIADDFMQRALVQDNIMGRVNR